MSTVRGVIGGALALAMMEAIVTSQQATDNVTGIVGFLSRGLSRWLDPTLPLIPDLRSPADQLAAAQSVIGSLGNIGISTRPGSGTAVPATGTPLAPKPSGIAALQPV